MKLKHNGSGTQNAEKSHEEPFVVYSRARFKHVWCTRTGELPVVLG